MCKSCSVEKIDISKNVQKEPWFIKLNPNGRIPVLVDRKRENFAVFETAAILLYLAQHCDMQLKFSFDRDRSPNDHSEMLQWIFFTVSGPGSTILADKLSICVYIARRHRAYARSRYYADGICVLR